MFRAARVLALTCLAASINAQYSVDSGTLKWNESGTPYGLPESTLIDALANPIASSNYTTGALLNETDDSASSMPPSFITTVSVVELPLGANNSAAADLVIETSNYRDVNVSGWEVCNTFFVFDDVKAFTDIFASTDDGSCSPFPDECVSQLQRLSCDNTQASGWPSECPETSTTMRSGSESFFSRLPHFTGLNCTIVEVNARLLIEDKISPRHHFSRPMRGSATTAVRTMSAI